MKKLLSFCAALLAVLTLTAPISVAASNEVNVDALETVTTDNDFVIEEFIVPEGVEVEYDPDAEIIGESQATSQSRLVPNMILTTFNCDVNGRFNFTFTNIIDTVDRITVTIKCTGANGGWYMTHTFYNIAPGKSVRSVKVPMKSVHETVLVNYRVKDGLDEWGLGAQTGSRTMPAAMVGMWVPGSFGSSQSCLNYHFSKHGAGLGYSDIMDFHRAAVAFKSSVPTNNATSVPGITPNVWRFRSGGRYIDVVGRNPKTGRIVSFGRG